MIDKLLILILFFIFFPTDPAYAYFDPGSSSILLQALLGGLAAVATAFTWYWNKIKNFFKRVTNKKVAKK